MKTKQYEGNCEEALVDLGVVLPPDEEPTEVAEPGERALCNPAVPVLTAPVLQPAAPAGAVRLRSAPLGDAGHDPAAAEIAVEGAAIWSWPACGI